MAKDWKYINRELSWLSFNERVLQEAEDAKVPLLERLRFLGIFSNNQDEFYRVRVATIARMAKYGKYGEYIFDELTPIQLLNKINKVVNEQQKKFGYIFDNILQELETEGIFIVNEKQLTEAQGQFVKNYFDQRVYSSVIPVMLNKLDHFPVMRDRSLYLAVKMTKRNETDQALYSLLRVPKTSLGRFLVLPSTDSKQYVILLDDVIRYCLDDIFTIFDYDQIGAYTIKMTRDAELDIDDEISTSLIEKMQTSLKKRKKGSPVRLVYDQEIPYDLLKFILKKMRFTRDDNLESGGRYHNHSDFMNFPTIGSDYLYYHVKPPLPHMLMPHGERIMKKMRERDLIVHYPYQQFTHIINLIREAAIDPDVSEICMTIYRVADKSLIMNALINAANNGKKVTVLIELLARFDEEANIYWSNKLQDEGVHVINGIQGLKVHSKIILIKRQEKGALRNYAYVGTGNFHEGTARIYADDGLLTADPRIANEVSNLFCFFKKNYMHFNYDHLVVAPFFMADFFIKKIDREIEFARSGKKAYIVLKLNSLMDRPMIDKLYEASCAGVKVDLIVRGICSLIPRVKGMSENIHIVSIVDKFLEHSRILIFGNNGEAEYYMGSADWMPRNLYRRIEVACPIYDKDIQKELRAMIDIQLKDNTKARLIDESFSNEYYDNGGTPLKSQDAIYEYIKENSQR